MFGHLWYLAEQIVALAFFDRDTTSDTKRRMVQALQVDGSTEIRKRATVDEKDIRQQTLDRFVTSNTMRFFRILGIEPVFLNIDPEDWSNDADYCTAEKIVKALRVINDVAERGVALMEGYNRLHTCDEEQKQYLLRVVCDHRRRFPDCRKETLAA